MAITRKEKKHHPLAMDLRTETLNYGEDNDCAVWAVAVVTGLPYSTVHAALAKHGRRSRRGTNFATMTKPALRDLGFEVERVPVQYFTQKYPGKHKLKTCITPFQPARFPRAWRDGNNYLIRTRGHILGVRNGDVIDWTHNRSFRSHWVYRVTKVEDNNMKEDKEGQAVDMLEGVNIPTVKVLQEVAKNLKIRDWWTLKKRELAGCILMARGAHTSTPYVKEFILGGGHPQECPPQPNPRIPPPTMKSAHKVKEKPKRIRRKKAKAEAPKKARGIRKPKEGYVTLSDISKEVGVSGRIARRRLRDAMKKPGGSWEWPEGHKDIETAKKIISGEVSSG